MQLIFARAGFRSAAYRVSCPDKIINAWIGVKWGYWRCC
jgi:hypothetical protein